MSLIDEEYEGDIEETKNLISAFTNAIRNNISKFSINTSRIYKNQIEWALYTKKELFPTDMHIHTLDRNFFPYTEYFLVEYLNNYYFVKETTGIIKSFQKYNSKMNFEIKKLTKEKALKLTKRYQKGDCWQMCSV
jgi:hypothetical protein